MLGILLRGPCIYILCFNIYVCSINVSILCLFLVSTMSAISANISSIPKLNNSNFKIWKEHVMTVLGCLDLDHVFRLDHPAALTNERLLGTRMQTLQDVKMVGNRPQATSSCWQEGLFHGKVSNRH